MVVPGGGLSRDGSKWIACRPRYFLPVEVLSALFRRLFLEMLVAARDAGHLQFFGDHAPLADKAAFHAYLSPLRPPPPPPPPLRPPVPARPPHALGQNGHQETAPRPACFRIGVVGRSERGDEDVGVT